MVNHQSPNTALPWAEEKQDLKKKKKTKMKMKMKTKKKNEEEEEEKKQEEKEEEEKSDPSLRVVLLPRGLCSKIWMSLKYGPTGSITDCQVVSVIQEKSSLPPAMCTDAEQVVPISTSTTTTTITTTN
ncbi:hypothetical protein HZH66_012833 [Vespula vulgaris]|uniref:Uncharacterized protein n=1 Tax=Vespula vulgaris TaxID=7454 RepID=A0A834J878_VESVU|nr:hypothetical protein HZH66_012833 [Vespula vulgaris]